MGTREELLRLFEGARGVYFSGEELAARLNISRSAVWKAVGVLRENGYDIEAAPKRGYRLSEGSDMLSLQGIRKYLPESLAELPITVLPEVDSTNAFLRTQAVSGAPEGTVVLALRQNAGRGRLGRSFYSPENTGIYLSLLLRPVDYAQEEIMQLTTLGALAVAQAIEEVSGKAAQIKWVNDVFLDGKKVSGILTEASFYLETGSPEFILLGVGINVYPPEGGFPQDLQEIAGAVFGSPVPDGKNRLAAQVLTRLLSAYRARNWHEITERYRARSFLPGKKITVVSPTGERTATALDIDDRCRLLVRFSDGTEAALSSGEVRILPY